MAAPGLDHEIQIIGLIPNLWGPAPTPPEFNALHRFRYILRPLEATWTIRAERNTSPLRPTVYLAVQAFGALSSVALSSRTTHPWYQPQNGMAGDIFIELTQGTFLKSFDIQVGTKSGQKRLLEDPKSARKECGMGAAFKVKRRLAAFPLPCSIKSDMPQRADGRLPPSGAFWALRRVDKRGALLARGSWEAIRIDGIRRSC